MDNRITINEIIDLHKLIKSGEFFKQLKSVAERKRLFRVVVTRTIYKRKEGKIL